MGKGIVSDRYISTFYTIAIATDMVNAKGRGPYRFPIYLGIIGDTDIGSIELSERSSNCLRRAGYKTIGDIVNSIGNDEDLYRIRGCGRKSVIEIMTTLLCYQFDVLSREDRKKYIKRILQLNMQ